MTEPSARAREDWPMFRHDTTHTGYSSSLAPEKGEVLWSYTTGDHVFSSPAVVGGRVYVGSFDDKVYCLDAVTGAHVWNYTTARAKNIKRLLKIITFHLFFLYVIYVICDTMM